MQRREVVKVGISRHARDVPKRSIYVSKILTCGNLTLIKSIHEVGYPREVAVLARNSYPRH